MLEQIKGYVINLNRSPDRLKSFFLKLQQIYLRVCLLLIRSCLSYLI